MTNYFCPGCRQKLQNTREVSFSTEPPTLGDLNLCGQCGCLSVFKLNGLEEISPNEFDALHPDEKANLQFAARNIAALIQQNKMQNFLRS